MRVTCNVFHLGICFRLLLPSKLEDRCYRCKQEEFIFGISNLEKLECVKILAYIHMAFASKLLAYF